MDVKGIDGSFSIESEEGDIRLQINKLVNTTYSPLSAHAVASKGSLSVLIDGQVLSNSTSDFFQALCCIYIFRWPPPLTSKPLTLSRLSK